MPFCSELLLFIKSPFHIFINNLCEKTILDTHYKEKFDFKYNLLYNFRNIRCIISEVIIMFWEYFIIAVVIIVIALVAIKVTRKDFDEEMNQLLAYLGGKDNIIDCELSMSRFKVTLKDVTKANKEGIQRLGAKGIVEIDNQLKIIFDKDSKKLKKYIKDLR